jgi:hypothetical protein
VAPIILSLPARPHFFQLPLGGQLHSNSIEVARSAGKDLLLASHIRQGPARPVQVSHITSIERI